jgi:dipeptidyl-peptidase-4
MRHVMRRCSQSVVLGLSLIGVAAAPALAQRAPTVQANWALAEKFSPANLRAVTYSTSVAARFINKTDSAWYNFRDRNGSRFMLVIPKTKTKQLMFDHSKLAADLSALHRKAFVPNDLPFTTITFADSMNASVFEFRVDSTLYSYDMRTALLTSKGRAPRGQPGAGGPGQGGGQGQGGGGGQGGPGGANQNFRNYSPDSTAFVFARDHNLYYVDVARNDTVKISTDGVQHYSFGARDTTAQACQAVQAQAQQQDEGEQGQQGEGQANRSRDPRVRASASWSKDSKAFYITRTDNRKVSDLFLINMLAEPRPCLMTYRYPMPGEENVRQTEVWSFNRTDGKLAKVEVGKWRDQALSNLHWDGDSSSKLRLIRRDRLRQNMELIEYDVPTKQTKVLLSESVQGATFEGSPVGISPAARYVNANGDFIWWSERTGWGHFYLYDHNGNLKNALTAGTWRAETIVEVDSVKRVAYIRGNGREPNENVYHTHLYRVNLDGSGFALLDQGDANHSSVLSTSKKYVIDNFSRPDLVPQAVLRDDRGNVLLELETMDLSRLKEMGWQMPETFIVKAADGVTDIYGNMWKPFDFDPNKKYPIIANVYPGPQTESVSTTFSANPNTQRLAQLGFIVIQIGNRGGSPRRSNAYQAYSYQNLRDYGLADKKAGIEQLAARYSFIDIDRVGLFGHSGGGFMTAAAMLLPPYNDFFKVGVSSAGNHDNNVYGDYWGEQNHGIREVPITTNTVAGRNQAQGVRNVGNNTGAGNNAQQGDAAAQTEAGTVATRFDARVPANHELAENLKGKLLLVHGDMDNNVHPAGTIRLVDALIKANKRFDFMIMPGAAHGFGARQEYFQRMLMEYFAEHLLGDYYRVNADIR